MKIPLLFFISIIAPVALGEVLIVPQGLGGSIRLSTNQTIFITHCQQKAEVSPTVQVIHNSVTNSTDLAVNIGTPVWTAIISGPIEFNFLASAAHFLNYTVLTNTQIQSFVARFGETNIVQVPTNKSVRFFQRIPKPHQTILTDFTIIQGTNSFSISPTDFNLDFAGPLTIHVTVPSATGPTPPFAAIFSYIIQETGSSILPQGVMTVPSSAVLTLEKSTDLQKWLPTAVIEKLSEPAAFYRFRSN
jgi:hypothetical protein